MLVVLVLVPPAPPSAAGSLVRPYTDALESMKRLSLTGLGSPVAAEFLLTTIVRLCSTAGSSVDGNAKRTVSPMSQNEEELPPRP
jgi:hypothetical protein